MRSFAWVVALRAFGLGLLLPAALAFGGCGDAPFVSASASDAGGDAASDVATDDLGIAWTDPPRPPLPTVDPDRDADPADAREVADLARRRTILYVTFDRPSDARLHDHQVNLEGLARALEGYDRSLRIVPVHIDGLVGLDAAALDAQYHPFAVFAAGSFTEWYEYARDEHWRASLDHWMTLIRSTRLPMIAVCGSHELVAIAFGGFASVAHMADVGAPVRVSTEIEAAPPRTAMARAARRRGGCLPARPRAGRGRQPV
jgi:hypothetical protein